MEDEAAKSRFTAKYNQIYAGEFLAPYGPICFNGVHDSVVAYNSFSGAGPAANFVRTYLPWLTDMNNEFIKNKLYQFEVGPGDWDVDGVNIEPIDGIAHIYLGPFSSNCYVNLRSSFDTVIDEGMDNTIVEPYFWFYWCPRR